MERTIKTLTASDGQLYMTTVGRRYKIADFTGFIEIRERQTRIPVLGRIQNGVKSVFASFVICGDVDFVRGYDYSSILSGRVFDASAFVENEKLVFSGLRYQESDPLTNTLTFEVTDLELIRKLLEL